MVIRDEDVFDYHEHPRPGKLKVIPSKPCVSQRDLSLAYTPGVARPCLAIHDDAEAVYRYTGKGNLVGVVSNGTAVLGLGNIGPLAAKPVMEGKAVLFKRFADIDVFDIELDALDPDEMIRTSPRSSRPSAASTWRTSRRRSASRSRSAPQAAWTSRCSTTTSTAPRSSPARRC